MRQFLSLALCAALASLSLGPGVSQALAGEVLARGEGRAAAVLPLMKLRAPLSPSANAGLGRLPVLAAVNAAKAQPAAAAAILAPVAVPAAGSREITARGQLDGVVSAVQVGAQGPAAGDGSRDKAAQDGVWTGLRPRTGGEPVSAVPAAPFGSGLRRAAAGAAASSAVLIPAAAWAAPTGAAAASSWNHWLQALASHCGPYLTVGAAAAVIFGVNKVVQRVIGNIGQRAGWDANTRVLAQRAAAVGTWGLGAIIGLHAGGAPASVIAAVAGLGGTVVTMAGKEILGNVLEASKVLLYHAFAVGDRLKIGAHTFKVTDLSLRYVTLQNEAFKSSPTNFTYLHLAGRPLTMLWPYQPAQNGAVIKSGISAGTLGGLLGKTLGSASAKTWLWLAGGLAAAVASSFVMPLAFVPGLATALAWLKAAAIMIVAHNVRTFVLDFVQRLSEKAGWNPQSTLVAKLAVEILAYAAGGGLALRALGTSWMALLGGLGATSLAFTLVTSDILSNMVQAAWLMSDRSKNKSFRIGDTIATSGLVGKVVDMNFQYLVLDHGDGTHSLLSYALLKDNEFTILSPEDVPAAKGDFGSESGRP